MAKVSDSRESSYKETSGIGGGGGIFGIPPPQAENFWKIPP